METKELDNLSRDELFEMLKANCKSNTRVNFLFILIALFFLILVLIWCRPAFFKASIIYHILFLTVFGCMVGFSIMYNYRLHKRIDTIETPDQLLNLLESKQRFENIQGFVAFLLLIVYDIVAGFDYRVAIGCAAGGLLYYLMNGTFVSHREIKLLEEVRDFVDKE